MRSGLGDNTAQDGSPRRISVFRSVAIRATGARVKRAAAFLLSLAVAGCSDRDEGGPVTVSVIGAPVAPLAADAAPSEAAADATAAVLAGAVRQGLIRFDAGGQVVPGLAARWIVSDTGRSLMFRLPDTGARIPAETIVRRLRAAAIPDGRNPLRPLLGAVGEISAVTPQVVDIELTGPRPNILALFAQPALAMATRAGVGGGPFELLRLSQGAAVLRTLPPETADPDAGPDAEEPAPPQIVTLRGERAATAVARFAAGRADLVLGGRIADLPIARVAALPAGRLRFDAAPGLFGFAFDATVSAFAAQPANRRALAMAVDRDRIARVMAVPGWSTTTAILPANTAEVGSPAVPDWADAPLERRRAVALAQVRAWTAAGRPLTPLRVAMPAGPGARVLFALVAADWRMVGVEAAMVGEDQPADLRLVDEVAPADTAAFYLRRFACERGVPCSETADAVLIAARHAPDLAERGTLLAQADGLIARTVPFIAIASPVRWSLVAPHLSRFRESPRAIHPLDELRDAPAR
jgi:peptide/nickel transport system substrate-binding protein